MLSRRPPDSDAAADNPVYLTAAFSLSSVLVISLYITVRRLIGQRADCPGAESLSFAEDNLRVSMGPALVLSREVKVDIRLFVALESKECLERDIESVLCQRFPADRAFFVRHITAGHTRKLLYLSRVKIIIMAFCTVIMRAQRIYLRDTRHCGHQG